MTVGQARRLPGRWFVSGFEWQWRIYRAADGRAPEQIENALGTTVRAIDPQLPLTQVQTMEHAVSDSEAPRRFNTALIPPFAGLRCCWRCWGSIAS